MSAATGLRRACVTCGKALKSVSRTQITIDRELDSPVFLEADLCPKCYKDIVRVVRNLMTVDAGQWSDQ